MVLHVLFFVWKNNTQFPSLNFCIFHGVQGCLKFESLDRNKAIRQQCIMQRKWLFPLIYGEKLLRR
jgi:hypothetical protein